MLSGDRWSNPSKLSPEIGLIPHLSRRADCHLTRLVSRLLDEEGVEDECWRRKVFDIAREVVAKVTPRPQLGDDMDINRYVDIILVPGGSIDDTKVVEGAILQRNFVHRKMKNKDFQRPIRYLIFESGIDLMGEISRITTLNRLLDLEDKALELFLAKLLSRRPDVVLLGRSICRSALEALLRMGILVLQNIDSESLHRVARLTGGEVLKTAEHLTHLGVNYGNDPIGFSQKFHVFSVYDDPEVMLVHSTHTRVVISFSGHRILGPEVFC